MHVGVHVSGGWQEPRKAGLKDIEEKTTETKDSEVFFFPSSSFPSTPLSDASHPPSLDRTAP